MQTPDKIEYAGNGGMTFETIKRPLNLLFPVQVWLTVIFILAPLLNFLVPRSNSISNKGLLDFSSLPFSPLASLIFSIPAFFIVFIGHYFLCTRLHSVLLLKATIAGLSIICLFLTLSFFNINNETYRTFNLYSISIIISAMLFNIPLTERKKYNRTLNQ